MALIHRRPRQVPANMEPDTGFNNPVLDYHLLGAVTVTVLALTSAGDRWGVGREWARPFVRRWHAALRGW
ncbi:MAG: hypothetical protein ACRDPQ_10695 [Nocardioidaceae bacterium]